MKAEERIRRNRIRRQRQLRRRLSLFAAAVLIALSMAGGSFIVRAENASPDVVYKYYTRFPVVNRGQARGRIFWIETGFPPGGNTDQSPSGFWHPSGRLPDHPLLFFGIQKVRRPRSLLQPNLPAEAASVFRKRKLFLRNSSVFSVCIFQLSGISWLCPDRMEQWFRSSWSLFSQPVAAWQDVCYNAFVLSVSVFCFSGRGRNSGPNRISHNHSQGGS